MRTVRALVRDDHPGLLEDHEWMFCAGSNCPIVYFTAGGDVIDKSAVRVRVGLKEKDAPRPVCYCFGHTVESMREEWDRTGRSTAMASITAKVKEGECRCEILNPEGICCLGQVNRIVKGLDRGGVEPHEPNGTSTGATPGIVGAVAAAVLASICCVGPVALLALGLGGAWMSRLRDLEPYRPIFVTLSIGLLGFAFHRVYGPGVGSCSTSRCANRTRAAIGKSMLWGVSVLVVGLILFPYLPPGLLTIRAIETPPGRHEVVLSLEKMHCPACAVTVRSSLLHVAGVRDARVSFEPPEAIVVYDPQILAIEELTEATGKAGFPSIVNRVR